MIMMIVRYKREKKMTSIPNSEPYGSTGVGNKCSKLLLKGVLQTKS